MPEPLAPVTLRAEIDINGQTYAYQQAVPRRDWDVIGADPGLRAAYEDIVRAGLGRTAMAHIQPPVTVHMPSELDEAVIQHAAEELEQQPTPDRYQTCTQCGAIIASGRYALHLSRQHGPALDTNQPREHCGALSPDTGSTNPRTECTLRPGHSGSHADDVGCRWWLDPTLADEEGRNA